MRYGLLLFVLAPVAAYGYGLEVEVDRDPDVPRPPAHIMFSARQ
jgi:hypothetical protein